MIESTGFLARLLAVSRGAQSSTGGLSLGTTVRAHVIARLGPQTWQLQVGDRILTARVAVPLQPGQEFFARVERSGNELLLRQLRPTGTESPLMRLLSASGIPRDAVAITIVQHLVHTHQSLDPAHIARLYRLARRLGLSEKREVRLLAVLVGKGLSPESPEAFARFSESVEIDVSTADDHRGDNERNHERRSRQRHPASDGSIRNETATENSNDAAVPREDDEEDPAAGEQEIEAVITDLASQLAAWTNRRSSKPTSLLQLFNHRIGAPTHSYMHAPLTGVRTSPPVSTAWDDRAGWSSGDQRSKRRSEGQWISIPLHLHADGRTRSALLRMYRPSEGDLFATAVLEVELVGRSLSFSVQRDASSFKVEIHPADQDRQRVEERASRLEAGKGIRAVVVEKADEGFDGFSSEDLSAIVSGVDEDV